MTIEPLQPFLEPVRKSVRVPGSVHDVFRLFTQGIGRWWPLAEHSLSQERARGCAIEPRPGGGVYEIRDDGERYAWGHVLIWEPPRRFVMTWHPGQDADTAQEVEVRFLPEDDGTRVELEHRGWQKLGAQAKEAHDGYESGWPGVLAHLADAARRAKS